MSRNDPRLREGVAVVTGAGAGLGQALSIELCNHGVRVIGLARGTKGLENTAAQTKGAFVPMVVDVADDIAVEDAFATIRTKVGPPNLLINNAAVYPRRDFLDETGASFMATVATNLGGTVACTRAALNSMVETGFGRIMNVSTFADVAPIPASSAYAVSKGAARIFTRAILADLSDRFPEIVVNDWMPGMLATKMGIPDGLDPMVAAKWGGQMALWHDPDLTGSVFEMDHEVLPARGIKGKIKDLLMMRRRQPRTI